LLLLLRRRNFSRRANSYRQCRHRDDGQYFFRVHDLASFQFRRLPPREVSSV
jgi:hypothetical protein